MSSEEYASLLAKLQGSDVDAKIDAVGKLQSLLNTEEFELTSIDDFIAALKVCLRTANQHLTTPTLLLLPALVRHLASNSSNLQHEIRLALISFLPSGGVFDRLGDARDRARDAAKGAIVSMASLTIPHAGLSQSGSYRGKDAHRGQETPMTIFEKAFRENGFGNKVARVREQSIQCLVAIRETYPKFPLRPYVSLSVELLEDGDGSVRDSARTAVVLLFTAPGVAEAARADLKNEMSKRGVRKTIMDAVLNKLTATTIPREKSVAGSDSGVGTDTEVLSRPGTSMGRRPVGVPITRTVSITSATGSANGVERPLSRQEETPGPPGPSVTISIPPGPSAGGVKSADGTGASASSADIPSVFIASARDLENELEKMIPFFQGKETEHNWADRERSIVTIRGIIRGVYARYPDVFIEGLKSGVLDGILKALASLRTTLSSHACALLSEMAEALQHAMDPFVDRILTALAKMSGFTKKIIAQQSQASVTAVINNTSAQPRVVLTLLWSYVQEKNVQSRSYSVEHLTTYLKAHAAKSKHAIENVGGVDIITKCLQKTLNDPNPGVRPLARACFWAFEPVWPANALVIAEQLDNSARKQLDKANPNPGACTPITPVEEVKKKPSVAAAIAASRAKAKAIANDPPTLRHAVTSPPARRAVSPPPAKTPIPPRQTSPRLPSTSRPPSRPPSRSAVSPGTRARSQSPVPPVPTLPRPNSRTSSPSPPSPTSSSSAHRKQVSTIGAVQSSPGRPSTLRSSYSQIRPGAKANGTNTVPATLPPVPRVKSQPVNLSKSVSGATQTPPSPTRRATSPVTPTRRSGQVTGSPGSRKPLPDHPLPSLAQRLDDSESLLHAATIPIPDDDDDDEPISFSTPFEKYGPTTPPAVTPPNNIPATIVGDIKEPEESLLAKAIQATSAASQLEDEAIAGKDDHPSPYPPELLPKNQARTPINRKIMREAALFQDSPQAAKTPTILDQLFEQGHQEGSWAHKRSVSLRQASVDLNLKSTRLSVELRKNIDALAGGTADESVLRQLAVICSENGNSNAADAANGHASPVFVPSSPTKANGGSIARPLTSPADIWSNGKIFDQLFDALTTFLTYDKSAEILDLGLAVIWEMLRHQWEYVTEHQSELWAFLIRLRYANSEQVLQGTNAIRDALTAAVEPIFGLATANGCLHSFLDEDPPSSELEPVRANSWAYGLVGMAKIMMRLPPDILEEEIPRVRGTLTTAICYEQSSLVRGAATVAIAACQMVLRDETHLFTLLGNLPNEKKNLLMYYFNRTGSRGPAGGTVEAGKVDEELRKIDRGTTLPPRANVLSPRRPNA
ncbi:Protein STU1 [Coccidioides immitis RS] [Rhizoctonia solani]|uniref:Protein STU1 [Coccidioides immitis RS] n=1 Tax=Rhizoctonia solani TaxID=456999 RepID=A0A0K6GGS2_9AGAM|nr:Protein STU1 [Coccidioides immitis RS] [Rhizoctonia solani]